MARKRKIRKSCGQNWEKNLVPNFSSEKFLHFCENSDKISFDFGHAIVHFEKNV
jgi:hypothetical protein